jgi:CBS-domain-containing membrane protein
MIGRDVMTRDVVSVTPDTPVRKVASLLVKHRIGAVPVIDDGGAPIGIVSEGDLIRPDRAAARPGAGPGWRSLLRASRLLRSLSAGWVLRTTARVLSCLRR